MSIQPKTEVTIRLATREDIEDLQNFIEPFTREKKLLPRTLDEIEVLLDHFYIAEYRGRMVGCAALEIYSHKLAEIRSLAVDPNAQGLGIGKKLVQKCVDVAVEENVFEVMAISSTDHFFHACGFDYTLPGERRAFFMQTRDDL